MSQLAFHEGAASRVPGKSAIRHDASLQELERRFDGEPLEVSFRHLVGPLPADDKTHSLYPYPARLVRQIPRFFLDSSTFASPEDTIVDPFCGSGTVLVEASRMDRPSVGIDANPMAALVSRVKTTPLSASELKRAAGVVVQAAASIDIASITPDFLRKWYSKDAFSALEKLSNACHRLPESPISDAIRIALALTARNVSRADTRVPVPVVDGSRNQDLSSEDVFASFAAMIEKVCAKVGRLSERHPTPFVISGDARDPQAWAGLPITGNTIILTSPPYGAAQKYVRSTSLESGWLGYASQSGTAEIDRAIIGRERTSSAERQVPFRPDSSDRVNVLLEELLKVNVVRAAVYRNYFFEMREALRVSMEAQSALKKIVLVCGTNVILDRHFPTNEILADYVRQFGFRETLVLKDEIRGRTLMTTRKRSSTPARWEYVHLFEPDTPSS